MTARELRRRPWAALPPLIIAAAVVFLLLMRADAQPSPASAEIKLPVAATAAGQAQPLNLDHFKCYSAQFVAFGPLVVDLRDQFGPELGVKVFEPVRFCNPVSKNGEPIIDPNAHLKCYTIQAPPFNSRYVITRNQFGKQVLKVDQPDRLCVPTQKQPHPAPVALDHFKCYPVTAAPFQTTVNLDDQFGPEPGVKVLQPVRLCNPVEKIRPDLPPPNVTPITNPDAHLVCYSILAPAPPAAPPVVTAINQFGTEDILAPFTPQELCVPSTKTIPEVDTFPHSSATLTVASPIGTDTATLTGPTTVVVDLSSLGDGVCGKPPNPANGREEVETEMVAMSLTGFSPLYGNVAVTLRDPMKHPNMRSLGCIEESVNNTPGTLDIPPFTVGGTADSFFDVFFEVSAQNVPPQFNPLHNDIPKHMQAVPPITHKPPAKGETYQDPQRINLFDENHQLQPGAVTAGPATHTPDPPLDHFKCYSAQFPPFTSRTVDLVDQFGPEPNDVVQGPVRFCNPVAKTIGGVTTPISDPAAHLKCYSIQSPTPFNPQTVAVRNQFGTQTLQVIQPDRLCLPTQKQPYPPPQFLDHFKCYRVTSAPFQTTVDLNDQFGAEPGITVLQPVLLCNPVQKTIGGVTTPILNPSQHLVCYTIQQPTPLPPIQQVWTVVNQFGVEDVSPTFTPQELCLPSTKTTNPADSKVLGIEAAVLPGIDIDPTTPDLDIPVSQNLTAFNVTSIEHNNGPLDAKSTITMLADIPLGCAGQWIGETGTMVSYNLLNPLNETSPQPPTAGKDPGDGILGTAESVLAQTIPEPVSATQNVTAPFELHCFQPSRHVFHFCNKQEVLSPPSDPNPSNNWKCIDVPVFVHAQADLKIVSMTVGTPNALGGCDPLPAAGPPPTPVSQTVPFCVQKVVHNNGPFGPVVAQLNLTVNAPSDCTVTLPPAPQVSLDVSVPSGGTGVQENFSIHCTLPSFHDFVIRNCITPKDPHVSDPRPENDCQSQTITLAVTSTADVKIESQNLWDKKLTPGVPPFYVCQPGTPPPATIRVSEQKFICLEKVIHNNGPDDAVVDIVKVADAPDTDVLGRPSPTEVSVHVSEPNTFISWAGGVNMYRKVDTNRDGICDSKVFIGVAPAGGTEIGPEPISTCWAADSLPGVFGELDVHVKGVVVPVSALVRLEENFDVHCLAPSTHRFTFTNEIVTAPHVADPNPNNNRVTSVYQVDCLASADGKIVSFNPMNAPSIIPPNVNVNITLQKTVHNNGPYGPVAFTLTKGGGSVPAGCVVTPPPAVTVNLAVSTAQTLNEVFTINCAPPGPYAITFTNTMALAANQPHVSDPNDANNSKLATIKVCVDSDGDGFCDDLENDCGSLPNNGASIPERIDGVYMGVDDDKDGMTDEALPPGAVGRDCDRDGYVGTSENHVYAPSTQGDQDPCGTNAKPPTVPPSPIGWPADLSPGDPVFPSVNKISLPDLTSYLAPVRYINTNVGTHPGDVRWDIVPGKGIFMTDINIADLSNLLALAPPMLGGARALNGPPCPWPP